MIEDKKIVAIIPARGGSKGVPRKNLRMIKGRTLLAISIESAKKSRYIDKVIVSSEDSEIMEEAKRAGAEVPFVRPSELAQDNTSGIDVVLHALDYLPDFHYVINLQVTSPLRVTEDIDRCIEYCYVKNIPSCISVTEVEQHPYWMFTINQHDKLQPFFSCDIPVRRQDLPIVYAANGAIYFSKIDWLLHNKKFITQETGAFVMSKERSLDLDTEFDFMILEAYLKNYSVVCSEQLMSEIANPT